MCSTIETLLMVKSLMDRHSSAYIEVEMDNIMRTDPTKYAGL